MRHKAIMDLLKKYDICVTEEVRSKVTKKYMCTFNALCLQWYKVSRSPDAFGVRIRKINDKDNLDISYIAGSFIHKIKDIESYIINNK